MKNRSLCEYSEDGTCVLRSDETVYCPFSGQLGAWGFAGLFVYQFYEMREQVLHLANGREVIELSLERAFEVPSRSYVESGLGPITFTDFLRGVEETVTSFVANLSWLPPVPDE